ncbi:Cytochrome c heme lyase subunit CcmL / Cytochrome c heme lyase subunit CcmH [Salmonella enterica subsp. enterica serovar Cerro]|nr:Cytochrome c heme lyase subunit CcmL / Cytochrome c heme lyase subunit CcmH [Salmonella enterica subsp. enterica serovar Cerro]
MRLLPGMVMLMLALVISGSARATTDVMPFKDEAQEQQFPPAHGAAALPEMPEQQHCGLERDDSHRHAPQGV